MKFEQRLDARACKILEHLDAEEKLIFPSDEKIRMLYEGLLAVALLKKEMRKAKECTGNLTDS